MGRTPERGHSLGEVEEPKGRRGRSFMGEAERVGDAREVGTAGSVGSAQAAASMWRVLGSHQRGRTSRSHIPGGQLSSEDGHPALSSVEAGGTASASGFSSWSQELLSSEWESP